MSRSVKQGATVALLLHTRVHWIKGKDYQTI